MKQISNYEAFQTMEAADFARYEQELSTIENQAKERGQNIGAEFYLDEDGSIVLDFKSNGEDIGSTLRFNGKRKKAAGRPPLGQTKKLSLTLTDDLWTKISRMKDEWNTSQSEVLRRIIENYFLEEKK